MPPAPCSACAASCGRRDDWDEGIGQVVPLFSLNTVDGDLYAAATISAPALQVVGGTLSGPQGGPTVPLPSLTSVGRDFYAPSVDAPNLRVIGGGLTLGGPQPAFPALESVGSITIASAGSYNVRIDPPFPLDSLTSLRRIEHQLAVSCVRGWTQADFDAFVDRVGRENIGGPITFVPATSSECRG